MTSSAPPEPPAQTTPRRRIAVFGSISPQSRALLSPAARAVFERILAAGSAQGARLELLGDADQGA